MCHNRPAEPGRTAFAGRPHAPLRGLSGAEALREGKRAKPGRADAVAARSAPPACRSSPLQISTFRRTSSSNGSVGSCPAISAPTHVRRPRSPLRALRSRFRDSCPVSTLAASCSCPASQQTGGSSTRPSCSLSMRAPIPQQRSSSFRRDAADASTSRPPPRRPGSPCPRRTVPFFCASRPGRRPRARLRRRPSPSPRSEASPPKRSSRATRPGAPSATPAGAGWPGATPCPFVSASRT